MRRSDDADAARVVRAVHDLPGRPVPALQAGTLARALGECLAAGSVTIVLWPPGDPPVAGGSGGHEDEGAWSEYQWIAPDATVPTDDRDAHAVLIRLHHAGRRLADLTVHPRPAADRLRERPDL
ncbi:MAG TPA: hypothetical protein VHA75_14425, partial [Rugosimonospora sp.]|nr:hypothetical protein [Rugosimonospora sp.]